MTPKNSTIASTDYDQTKIFEYFKQNLPKGDIDLSKMSQKAREELSIFDTIKKDGSSGADGYLSRSEFSNALDFFNNSKSEYLIPAFSELKSLIDNKKNEEAKQIYNKLKLKPTHENKNLYKSANGSLYRFDSTTKQYVELSNIDSVSKDGYTKKAKFGNYGWTVSTKYASDGTEKSIQLNKSNGELEKDKNKIAKAFGLLPEYTSLNHTTGRYIDAGTGGVYIWNDKTSSFNNINKAICYQWEDNKIIRKPEVESKSLISVGNLANALSININEKNDYQLHFYTEDKYVE